MRSTRLVHTFYLGIKRTLYWPSSKVSTPFKIGNSETRISRQGQTIATIHWKVFGKSTVTMNGKTSAINDVFPRSKTLST